MIIYGYSPTYRSGFTAPYGGVLFNCQRQILPLRELRPLSRPSTDVSHSTRPFEAFEKEELEKEELEKEEDAEDDLFFV